MLILKPEISDDLANHIVDFLTDYTTDRRGDIGSFIRIEAIQAVQTILYQIKSHADTVNEVAACIDRFVGCLCRLAVPSLPV